MRAENTDAECRNKFDMLSGSYEPGNHLSGTCGNVAEYPDLQERIVRHCSPTLAGLKCGSMFRVDSDPHGLLSQIRSIERELMHRGVRIAALSSDEDGCLIYVYRPSKLDGKLSDAAVRDFLSGYGYSSGSAEEMVAQLTSRFYFCPMPPEVGVFLDYPLEDVVGYIQNSGRCSRCIGCWKVYGDVASAERRFNSYKKCRDVFHRRFSEGSGLVRLAIKA